MKSNNVQTHNKEPLGLPRGSVRAIITILALASYFIASGYSMFSEKSVPEGLTNIAITVIAFYFGTRSNTHEIQNETIVQGDIRDFENVESNDNAKYQKVSNIESDVMQD